MGSLIHKLDYLAETKVKIREALQKRGSKVTEEDTFRSYADYISNLQSGVPSSRAGSLYGRGGIGIAGQKKDIM